MLHLVCEFAPDNNRLPAAFAALTSLKHGSLFASRAGNLETLYARADHGGLVSLIWELVVS